MADNPARPTPTTEDRFERMGAGDETQTWEPVDAEIARLRLSDCYRDIDALVDYMRAGHIARTPFAFYRVVSAISIEEELARR